MEMANASKGNPKKVDDMRNTVVVNAMRESFTATGSSGEGSPSSGGLSPFQSSSVVIDFEDIQDS